MWSFEFLKSTKLRVLLQQLMFGVLICQHWITSVKLADASKPTLADTGLQREEEAVVLEQCDCREGIQIYAVSSGSFSQTSLRKPVHFYGGHRWVPVPQGPTMSILLPWCCWSMELPRLKAGQPFRLLTDYSVKGGTPWARLSWLTWREDLSFGPQSGWFILKNLRSHWGLLIWHLGMDQYLLIPFLVGRTSIYQLFWCSPGVQGFDTLPFRHFSDNLHSFPSRDTHWGESICPPAPCRRWKPGGDHLQRPPKGVLGAASGVRYSQHWLKLIEPPAWTVWILERSQQIPKISKHMS